MIIKNIFGNTPKKSEKTSSLLKFCSICEAKFGDNDSQNLNYCNDCVETKRTTDAAFWKNHFLQKKANTLAPDMVSLYNKLNQNKSLLEGSTIHRPKESNYTRSAAEIRESQAKQVLSFEDIRNQVIDHLPGIIAELGISPNKVDISLLADMIVPIKINQPLATISHLKTALKDIVLPELIKSGAFKDVVSNNGLIKSENKFKNAPDKNLVIREGLRRASGDEAGVRKLEQPTVEVEEVVGEVVRIPDEEDKVSEGVPELLNEGIGLHSEKSTEPESEPQEDKLPHEGEIRRVEQSLSPQVRKLEHKASVALKASNMDTHGSFGKKSSQLPVRVANLSEKAKFVISQNRPIAVFTAEYSDRSEKSWNYYLTDKGGLFISAGSVFNADTPLDFVNFIKSDASFRKWANLPEELIHNKDEDKQESTARLFTEDELRAKGKEAREKSEESEEFPEELLAEILEMLEHIEHIYPYIEGEDCLNLAIEASLELRNRKTAKKESKEKLKKGDEKQMKHANEAVNDILVATAGLDFMECVPTLVEAGYSDNEILEAFAACSEPKFNAKEHRQQEHIQESEEKAGKSPEKAEEIGYATINKQKHEAAMGDKQNGDDAANSNCQEVASGFGSADEEAKRGLDNPGKVPSIQEILKHFEETNEIGASDDNGA